MISIVRFGPIPEETEHAFCWGFLGWSPVAGSFLVRAHSDEEGIAAIVSQADGEAIRCDPALSAAARALGLTVGTPPLETFRMAAVCALGLIEVAESQPESRILLLEACTRFLAKKAWKQWPRVGSLGMLGFGIELSGPVSRCSELMIARSPDDRDGNYTIGLFEDAGSTEAFLRIVREGAPCRLRGLVLILSEEPSWTAEVVSRGYGQTFVAHASHTGPDGPEGCTVPDAAALAAVLDALGRISGKSRKGVARIETLYGAVRAEVTALRA